MRIAAPIAALVCLSSCGGGDQPKPGPTAAAETAIQSAARNLPRGVKPSSDVVRDMTVAGVWRSSAGVVKDQPDAVVQLEIANDLGWMLTLRSADKVIVYATLAGRSGWSGDGLSGSASRPRPSPLAPFATWSASSPVKGSMLLTPLTTKGDPIRLILAA